VIRGLRTEILNDLKCISSGDTEKGTVTAERQVVQIEGEVDGTGVLRVGHDVYTPILSLEHSSDRVETPSRLLQDVLGLCGF
jgi:hypothetical protein